MWGGSARAPTFRTETRGRGNANRREKAGRECRRKAGHGTGGRGADQVLDDDGVHARLGDLAHHGLQGVELRVEDEDVEDGVAEHAVRVQVGHDLGELIVGVEVGRAGARVELAEAEVDGVGAVLHRRPELGPSSGGGENFGLADGTAVGREHAGGSHSNFLLIQAGVFAAIASIRGRVS